MLQTSAHIVSTQPFPQKMRARFRFLGNPAVAPCRLADCSSQKRETSSQILAVYLVLPIYPSLITFFVTLYYLCWYLVLLSLYVPYQLCMLVHVLFSLVLVMFCTAFFVYHVGQL